jgi:uncharacterized protein
MKKPSSLQFRLRYGLFLILSLLPTVLFIACNDNTIAGTDAGNANKVVGILVDGEGDPVSGAHVYLRSAQYQPALDSASIARLAQGIELSTFTKLNGHYEFQLTASDTGQFVVEALIAEQGAIQIPFHRVSNKAVTLNPSALKFASQLKGTVTLPPGHFGNAVLALLGTRYQMYFSQGRGTFDFPVVAPGTYTLRIEGLAPKRQTLDTLISLKPGQTLSLDLSAGNIMDSDQIKVLIVDGINNHDWQKMTRYHKTLLEQTGLFKVDVSTTPPDSSTSERWSQWNPRFSEYDVVILHCNSGHGGDDGKANPWPDSMQTRLEKFVSAGGGLVNTHASFPAFLGWSAYEEMRGLKWQETGTLGTSYQVDSAGELSPISKSVDSTSFESATSGGEIIGTVNRSHPINQGLPLEWLHPVAPLVYRLKGNPQGITVLSYAVNPITGDKEPQQWTKDFGQGRIFTTTLGHLLPGESQLPFRCAGYQTYLIRGVEWAATGRVTYTLPSDFPTKSATSLRSAFLD